MPQVSEDSDTADVVPCDRLQQFLQVAYPERELLGKHEDKLKNAIHGEQQMAMPLLDTCPFDLFDIGISKKHLLNSVLFQCEHAVFHTVGGYVMDRCI